MNPHHAHLLAELRDARPDGPRPLARDVYGGSGRAFLNLSVPSLRAIARAWLTAHKNLELTAFLAVVESLLGGETHDERTLAALLLAAHPKGRRAATPGDVERWLGALNGWAEVDALCANLFTAEEMLADWPAWSAMLSRLARSADINRRRASLVLLVGPVRYRDDAAFRDLALANIALLKAERAILITKAVSWLMRGMVARHRAAVERLIEAEGAALPAIALRETRHKLASGVKSGRRRASS